MPIYAVLIAPWILLQTPNDYLGEHEIIEVKLSDTKYAANFPVTINNNQTISLFDTGVHNLLHVKCLF